MLDQLTKQWLQDNPYDPSVLPPGWEIRFGMRGRFLKYDSIEHVEQKNQFVIRETGVSVPFGYCYDEWNSMKANLEPGDEIWRYGGDGGEVIYLVRNNQIINDPCGHPLRGYHILLTCY